MIEPVRKELIVRASQQRCFEAFTQSMDAWWPRKHHIGKSPMKQQLLECRLGGRWYAISEDGSECDLGKVLAWDPYSHLCLSWQISAAWAFDPGFVTEVDLQFVAKGPHETLVIFEHRGLDAYGPSAPEIRSQIGHPDGWPAILDSFKTIAEA